MVTKQAMTAEKTSQTNSRGPRSGNTASSSAAAQTPPTYGIDLADSAPVQKIPLGKEQPIGVKAPPANKQPRNGLPDNLKAGVESLSGYAMDDVKVHYNSAKPAQLQAHAYAQGTDIHLAPGQERHLPHEAWHVVQQKQGRVKPTRQFKGKLNINDDVGLEKEADVMGSKALQTPAKGGQQKGSASSIHQGSKNLVTQRKPINDDEETLEWEVEFQEAARKMGKLWRAKAGRVAAKRQKADINERNLQFGLSWDNILFNPTGVGEEGWEEFQARQEAEYNGNVRPATYEAMAGKYREGVSAQDRDGWIKEMILSGSTLPNERKIKKGATFIKLMKIDDPRTLRGNRSPYYIDQSQFLRLMRGDVDMEQQLGLPTTSHGAFYKIHFLKAKRDTTVFESAIAPTEQYRQNEYDAAQDKSEVEGFRTTGGGRQTLIIDSQNFLTWKVDSQPPLVINSARVSAPMKFIWELPDWEETFLTEYEKAQAHYGNVEALLPNRLAKKRLEGRRFMMKLMNP